MNFKINVALINLNEQINFIDLEIDNQIEKCKNSIDVILKSVSEIKKIVLKSGFKVDTEEIQFFKELKPQFTSKLIYYNVVYKIEMKRPNGGNRILKKYYNNPLCGLISQGMLQMI